MAEEIKTYADLLKEVFPQYGRVRKISLNAGFSCPNLDGTSGAGGCAYCNNSSFSPAASTGLSLSEQLENGIRNIRARRKEIGILAYFQSYTNTHAPAEKLREIFAPVISHSEVAGIAIGTRPDCLQPEVAQLLAELNRIKPVIAEIGVQTANSETLKNINRGHDAQSSRAAALLCKSLGLLTTAHIIIGLPGEGMGDFINTAKLVRDCGFSSVKIHPLHIVKGTRFAKEYEEGKIELLPFEDYCKAAAETLRILQPDIAIERVSAESLGGALIAPAWSGDRAAIWEAIAKELAAEPPGQEPQGLAREPQAL